MTHSDVRPITPSMCSHKQTFAKCTDNKLKDRLAVADSKMGRSNWAKIEIGAGECKIPRLFGPRGRRSLQRFIGDFVSENLFFRPVETWQCSN